LSYLIDEQKKEVLRREGYSKNEAKFGSKNQFIRYAVSYLSTDKKAIKEAEEIFEIIYKKANFDQNFKPYKLDSNRLFNNIIKEVKSGGLSKAKAEKMDMKQLPQKIQFWVNKHRRQNSTEESIIKSDPVIELIKSKGQVILYGPPGTGKTYMTKEKAIKLLS
jgi:SpoVK/Ycf46/Vps4 family AAA+-type ATPase